MYGTHPDRERCWKDRSTSKTFKPPYNRGFVERGLAGKALFERVDNRFHLRAQRSLDHDRIAGANRPDRLGFETSSTLGIASPFARGKGIPQIAHQRTT